jgi:hypothetical protein
MPDPQPPASTNKWRLIEEYPFKIFDFKNLVSYAEHTLPYKGRRREEYPFKIFDFKNLVSYAEKGNKLRILLAEPSAHRKTTLWALLKSSILTRRVREKRSTLLKSQILRTLFPMRRRENSIPYSSYFLSLLLKIFDFKRVGRKTTAASFFKGFFFSKGYNHPCAKVEKEGEKKSPLLYPFLGAFVFCLNE